MAGWPLDASHISGMIAACPRLPYSRGIHTQSVCNLDIGTVAPITLCQGGRDMTAAILRWLHNHNDRCVGGDRQAAYLAGVVLAALWWTYVLRKLGWV
jgi:hypothetical protein